jgi:N utilization substance protein B
MGTRRAARELVVQYFYQWDSLPAENRPTEEEFWTLVEPSEASKKLATEFIQAMRGRLPELDEQIRRYLQNWSFDRLTLVDRNIMRLALFEMHHRPDIPPVVSINEAVEIAKRFSTEESGKFVNGMLDQARKDIDRPARERNA